jgi:hypothetical protein
MREGFLLQLCHFKKHSEQRGKREEMKMPAKAQANKKGRVKSEEARTRSR